MSRSVRVLLGAMAVAIAATLSAPAAVPSAPSLALAGPGRCCSGRSPGEPSALHGGALGSAGNRQPPASR